MRKYWIGSSEPGAHKPDDFFANEVVTEDELEELIELTASYLRADFYDDEGEDDGAD